jgi:hypothetical protein
MYQRKLLPTFWRSSDIIVLRHACQFHVVTFLQLKSSLQLQRVSVVSHVKTTVFNFCELTDVAFIQCRTRSVSWYLGLSYNVPQRSSSNFSMWGVLLVSHIYKSQCANKMWKLAQKWRIYWLLANFMSKCNFYENGDSENEHQNKHFALYFARYNSFKISFLEVFKVFKNR